MDFFKIYIETVTLLNSKYTVCKFIKQLPKYVSVSV